MSIRPYTRLRVAPAVHFRRFGGELVVLDLSGGEYFALNEMGARIWSDLAQGRAVSDVVEGLAQEYELDQAQASSDLEAFADELVAKGLLVPLF